MIGRRPVAAPNPARGAAASALPDNAVGDPFAPGVTFLTTPQLAQHLDLLHHLIQYSDLLLLVSGGRGAGKTAFVDRLLERAGSHWQVCRISATGTLGEDQLLEALCTGFELRARGGTADYAQLLHSHLEALARSHQIGLVVIDDAHLLPAATLDLVGALADGWEGLQARVLLVQEGPVPDRLRRRPEDDFTHLVELPALTEEQTGDYIAARLARAGVGDDHPFSPAVVQSIHKASAGIPGSINTLAAQVLANHRPRSADRQRKARGIPWWLPVAAAAAFTAIFMVIYLGPGESQPPAAEVRDAPAVAATPAPGAAAATPAGPAPIEAGSSAPPAATDSAAAAEPPTTPSFPSDAEPVPAEQIPAGAPTNDTMPTLPTPAQTTAGAATTPVEAATTVSAAADSTPVGAPAEVAPALPTTPSSPIDAEPVPAEQAPSGAPASDTLPTLLAPAQTAAAAPTTPFQAAETIVSAAADAAPKAPSIDVTPGSPDQPVAGENADPGPPAAASNGADRMSPQPTSTTVPAQTRSEAAAGAPAKLAASAAPKPAIPTPTGIAHGPDWVRARPASAYTVQLMGSHDPDAVSRFVVRNGIVERAAWLATLRGGKPWYVVIYGQFADKDAARRAIAGLSTSLREGGPWPRPFAEVQQLVEP